MRTLIKVILLLSLTLIFAGCSNAPIKLYPGDTLPASQLAVIAVPSDLEILSLNGKEVPAANRLLGTKDRQLHLQPGNYQLLVFYKRIWQTSAESHETIHSNPIKFDLSLQANHTYQIQFERPATAQQAQKLVQTFDAWLIDNQGNRSESQPSGLIIENSLASQLTGKVKTIEVGDTNGNHQVIAPLDIISTPVKTTTEDTQPPPSLSYLDLLKAQWQQASADEKREFLQWISQ